jgi:hypothetical protein
VYAQRDQPNAALQMAHALEMLMSRWLEPFPNVCASTLMQTSLGHSIMRHMQEEPHRCALAYNRAVGSLPEAGIGTLLIRDEYVELPLWRIRSDGRRMRAYDNDLEAAISESADIQVYPRALLMTALVRLGMCDLFIHGTGGANYDRAMERWVADWLGIAPGAMAVVSATMHLPLAHEVRPGPTPAEAQEQLRRAWHDPESAKVRSEGSASPTKRALLERVASLPRNSAQRKAAFLALHEHLQNLREQQHGYFDELEQAREKARRSAEELAIAQRRDWAFPLYPPEMIDALNARVAERFSS